MVQLAERPMAKDRKNTPVRIDDESLDVARMASGYTGESMAEYISRIVKERGLEDVQRLHAERFGDVKKSKPKNGGGA